ncbi:hypothetical protein CJ030_MR3G015772 [Morella rubra]|uniref:Uncharacterized protein n=1 Tax=Morella rubra TaxID=262757 RepID=A0A6A1W5H9_9ROSI|nr:hypothetical protein CJ030_MR3G015772 [Morella rubra]
MPDYVAAYARNVSSCAALYRMAMKKRADLCPSEADALNLSMAMWVTPSSRRCQGRFHEHFVRVSCFAKKLLNPVPGTGRQPGCAVILQMLWPMYSCDRGLHECIWSFVVASGLEDVSPMFSPTSGVHTEIPVPAVKEIREIGTHSFSVLLTAPLGHDLPEAAGGVKVHSGTIWSPGALPSITPLVMETPLEEPRTSRAVVIGDSGILALDLANESTTTAVNVAGDVEELDSEPSALPSWRLRPYAQPPLNEEMMEDALLTRSLFHCVSLVAALDAAELKHDEELESSRLNLRKLEGELEL